MDDDKEKTETYTLGYEDAADFLLILQSKLTGICYVIVRLQMFFSSVELQLGVHPCASQLSAQNFLVLTLSFTVHLCETH